MSLEKELRYFSQFVWWEEADYLIKNNPLRIIASAMRYANNVRDFVRLEKLDKDLLKQALKNAQPGWLDIKSWYFWHYRLYGAKSLVPPFPKRSFLK